MSQIIERIKNAVKFKSGESTSSNKVQSWTVRDSRPCRNRMTNNYATGTFTGLIGHSLAVATVLAIAAILAVVNAQDTHATQASLNVTLPTEISLDLNARSSSGTFATSDTSTTTFGIKTDNYTGYTLRIAAIAKDNTALINTNDNSKTIPSLTITNGVSESNYKDDTYASNNNLNNTWGYRPSKYNSNDNSNYLPAPTSTTPDVLDATTEANNTTANNYNIAIGARVSNTATIGSYGNTFVLSVVANDPEYSITYNKNTTDNVTNMPTNISTTTISSGTVTISSNEPSRDGYTFNGWCTSNASTAVDEATCTAASGTYYAKGATYTIDQVGSNALELYAMWAAQSSGGGALYDLVASKVRKNGNTELTQSLSDMQAVITTDNSGIYKYDASTFGAASDASNDKTIYYYRGILDSSYASSDSNGGYGSAGDGATWPNYVILDADGTKTTSDTCWRIVRTTGSGGVKMIYNGNWTGSTCANATTAAQITLNSANTFYFNRPSTYASTSTSSCTSSNARCGTLGFITYVGYNYNSTYGYNNTSYTSAITNSTLFNNGTNSNIKTQIETWYNNNLTSYTSKLETSAGYCNDRTTYTSTSASASPTTTTVPYKTSSAAVYFGAHHRNAASGNKLSLTCPNTTGSDLLTTSNGLGKPVALLTEDEVALAGNGYYTSAPTSASTYSSNWAYNSFLRSGSAFWLLSPDYRYSSRGDMFEFILNTYGQSYRTDVWAAYGVRPAISLKSGTTAVDGSGTATDPWIVNP